MARGTIRSLGPMMAMEEEVGMFEETTKLGAGMEGIKEIDSLSMDPFLEPKYMNIVTVNVMQCMILCVMYEELCVTGCPRLITGSAWFF